MQRYSSTMATFILIAQFLTTIGIPNMGYLFFYIINKCYENKESENTNLQS